MLVKFTVENYKNFANPIALDFSNVRDYHFNENCIKEGLLNKVVIYGPNSSGKSNLGYALFDIVPLLTDKFVNPILLDPGTYLNADSDKLDAVFTYEFRFNNTPVLFEYKKTAPTNITFERLQVNGSIVYEYDFIKKGFGRKDFSLIDADSLNFDYFENNFSILRYVANNTIQAPDSIVKKIMDFVSGMLWFRSLQDNAFIGLTTVTESLGAFIVNNNLTKDFQAFLKRMSNIDVDLKSIDIPGSPDNKVLIENHKKMGFAFESVASSGTKALELFYYWTKKFDKVTFLFIDEFDAFYHFELAKRIIEYVINFDDFQTVFTTHNSYLASNNLLRPDCYLHLKNGTITSFADSTERELREGHNLEKMLRNGEFDIYE